MALYAVGDIQGCYTPLVRLLDQVNFDQNKDTLVCVGDLVNRGPDSLKVLRLLISLGDQCKSVLGNHDIHLLSMIYGVRSPRSSDTFEQVLKAPDVGELANWLRRRPLMAQSPKRNAILCHAGIYPWWSREQAQNHSNEILDVMSNEKQCVKLLSKIYSDEPLKWQEDLNTTQRQRFIINAFTRMRFCDENGHLNLTESGFAGKKKNNRLPWFEISNPSLENYRIIFGHWSALGLLNTPTHLCLDTGCVWGQHMTLAKIPKSDKKSPIKSSKLFIAQNY